MNNGPRDVVVRRVVVVVGRLQMLLSVVSLGGEEEGNDVPFFEVLNFCVCLVLRSVR